MNRHRYRLQEYFDLLDGREEITEAELRTMVNRFEGYGSLSTPLPYGGVFMTTILVLCGLVLGGGLFRQTDERSPEKRTAYAPLAQRHIERKEGNEERGLHESLRNPEGRPLPHRIDGRSPIAGNGPGSATPEDSIQMKLRRLPWGYRFVPGQKLLYEYGATRINPSNGDSIVAVRRALIEVERIDQEGNMTLQITTGSPALLIDESINTTPDSTSFAEQYQVTITRLGEVIAGSVLYGRQSDRIPDEVTPSDTEEKSREKLERLRQEIGIWLPRWPARENFNNDYKIRREEEKADTVRALTIQDVDAPSPLLDTIGKEVRYVATQIRATGQADARGIVFRERRSEESVGRVLWDERYIKEPNVESPAERKLWNDSYRLDTASLTPENGSIRLQAIIDSRATFAKGILEETEERRETGELTFRKSDGVLMVKEATGASLQSRQERLEKSFMTRNESMSTFSSSLRLIRSDMPERESETDVHSIDLH